MECLVEAFTKHATNKMSIEEAKELISNVSSQRDGSIFDCGQFIRCYLDDKLE
jgi:hypothetical protein